jgi:hypothetical protein
VPYAWLVSALAVRIVAVPKRRIDVRAKDARGGNESTRHRMTRSQGLHILAEIEGRECGCEEQGRQSVNGGQIQKL